MPRYSITIEAASLGELVGAVTEAASLLQTGDASQAMVSEVAQLAEQLAMPDSSPQPSWAPEPGDIPGLPLPPPDYEAAGLTRHQQMQVAQAQSQPAPAMAQMHPMTQVQAPTAPVAYAPAQTVEAARSEAVTVPFCPVHMQQMMWKGGALSRSGKQQPLWSCPDRNCREAIWPPR